MANVTRSEFDIYMNDFQELDLSGSGFLSKDELRQMCTQQAKRRVTDDELEETFSQHDLDGDGKVTLFEYITAIVSAGWFLEIVDGVEVQSDRRCAATPEIVDAEWRRHWQIKVDPTLRGVSVAHLSTKFIELMDLCEHDVDANVGDVESSIIRPAGASKICPVDDRMGCAYVHTLEIGDEAGPADYMLSYTWGYPVRAIIEALESHCARTGIGLRQTKVWICCLCINQHRVQEARARGEVVPAEEFRAAFEGKVHGIQNILALVMPWKEPRNLKRVWCLLEVYSVFELRKRNPLCTFQIIMPPSEHKDFCQTLLTDFDAILLAISQVDLEAAEASVQSDKDTILTLIRETMGFHQVNKDVLKVLREWLIDTALQHLKDVLKKAYICDGLILEADTARPVLLLNKVARLLQTQGQYTEARELLEEAVDLVGVFGSRHELALLSSQNMGSVLHDTGKFREAESLLRRVLRVKQETIGISDVSTLLTAASLGGVLQSLGKHAEAEELLKSTLEMRRNVLGDQHKDTMTSVGAYADILQLQSKLTDAEELYREALSCQKAMLGPRHPDTLTTVNNLGMLLHTVGRCDEAEPLFREDLDSCRVNFGDVHPDTLDSINNLALLLEDQGNLAEAEQLYREALSGARITFGQRHQSTIISIKNLGIFLQKQPRPRQQREGMRLLEEARL